MKRFIPLLMLMLTPLCAAVSATAQESPTLQKTVSVPAQKSPDLSRNVIIVGNKKFYPLSTARHYTTRPATPLLTHTANSHGVRVIRPHATPAEATSSAPDVLKAPEAPAAPTPPSAPVVESTASTPPATHSPATAKDVISLFEPDEPTTSSIKH